MIRYKRNFKVGDKIMFVSVPDAELELEQGFIHFADGMAGELGKVMTITMVNSRSKNETYFDAIEAKNITRQMFPDNAIGEMKSIVSAEGMTSDALNFKAFTFKVEKEDDLAFFDYDNDIAILCTDNMQSKKLLGSYFTKFLMVNCDEDYYEIQNRLTDSDFKVWTRRDGYNSTQTFVSNLMAAMHVYNLLVRHTKSIDVFRSPILTRCVIAANGSNIDVRCDPIDKKVKA